MAMITMIKKRDGRQVPFNIEKIANAIFKAAQTVGGKDYSEAMELADRVCQQLSEEVIGRDPSVEEVQDMVERVLVEQGHAKTAKAYILYRADRTRAREMNSTLMKIYEDLTFMSASDCDIKRENANIDGDTAMGTMLKYGSEGAKQFNEMYVLDPKHSQAHINGDIHIHDLDFLTLTTTCCQIDLLKLFHGGFPPATDTSASRTIFPATRRLRALPFSLTRTTSTAVSPCRYSTTPWRRALKRPSADCTPPTLRRR